MEELWSANQYGSKDAASIYNKQVQKLLIELGGGEEAYGKDLTKEVDKDGNHISANYWGHTQQAKLNEATMGFTHLGIAVVHYRFRLICVSTGLRTAFFR